MPPEDDDELGLADALEAALDEQGGEQQQREPVRDEPFPQSERQYNRDEGGKFAKAPEQQAKQPWRPMWYKDEFGPWDKTHEGFRKALEEREKQFAAEIEKRAGPMKAYQEIEAALGPEFTQQLKIGNVSPSQYVTQLHAANQFLQSNPVQALQYLAQQVGVDLVALADQIVAAERGQGGEQQPQQKPAYVQQLEQQVAALAQKLGGFEQSTQAQRRAEADATIQEFAKDKPYFDQVKGRMSALLQTGQAATLADAYDQAIWSHPEIRQRIQADQRKADVERARTGAVSPRGAPNPNGRATHQPRMSLQDEIASLIDGAATV